MLIIAHRGLHSYGLAPNSPQALLSACRLGFGIETDLRDHSGHLVISHDTADSDSPDAESLFSTLAEYNDSCCFALNIKADGLKHLLFHALNRAGITNYFAFDMSIPQMKDYRDSGLVYFTGQSDIQPEPVLYDNASGVWADCFEVDEWITREVVEQHIANGKRVCFVSPDLHGREYRDFWARIREYDDASDSLMLCTDYPIEARESFTGGNHD